MSSAPAALTETSLNGSTLTVSVANGTFASTLEASGFSLISALPGVSIASASRSSATQAVLTLAWDGSDFDVAGSIAVTVRSTSLATGSAASTGAVTVSPAPVSSAVVAGPATAVAATIAGPFTVATHEAAGSSMTVADPTVFALSSTSSDAASFYSDAGGTSAITTLVVPAGQASATFYYKNATTGSATITARWSSGGAQLAAATAAVTLTAPVPSALSVRTQPDGAVSGQRLTTQPVIEIRDAAGNLATGAALAVTATITPASNILTGTTTVAAQSGVATFTDLTVAGNGSATLTFTAAGLTSATSANLVIGQPPSLVLASGSASLTAPAGSATAQVQTVAITNGGAGTLSGLSVGAVVYGTGQPTGWLSASLSASSAPATLTLSAAATALAAGTYTASVPVTSNGGNSPQSVTVTFLVTASQIVEYGSRDAAVAYLPIGSSSTPPSTSSGVTTVAYVSRAPGVATVSAAGTITGTGAGSGWVVAVGSSVGSTATASDSVWVVVPPATGPVLRTTLSRVQWKAGDTISVDFVMDTRGDTVGSATALLLWGDGSSSAVRYVDLEDLTGGAFSAQANLDLQNGLIRLTVARASGLSGSVSLVRLRFVALNFGASGTSGWVYFTPQDVVGVSGNALTAATTGTRYPVIIR